MLFSDIEGSTAMLSRLADRDAAHVQVMPLLHAHPAVYLRLPDPEEPAAWWLTVHDSARLRVRQIELRPDGTAAVKRAWEVFTFGLTWLDGIGLAGWPRVKGRVPTFVLAA